MGGGVRRSDQGYCGCRLEIGETVEYEGQRWVVGGFTRVSSDEQHVVLKDSEAPTTVVTVPLRNLEADQPQPHSRDEYPRDA